MTPDGHYALVTYQNTSNVGVFNLHRALHRGFSPADLVGLIPVGPQPIGVAVAPNGGLAYVTSQPRQASASGNGVVNVISVAKAETRPAASVIKTVSAGCKPSRVVVSADGQQLWVTAGGSNALLGFSAPKLLSDPGHALLARVPVGPLPLGLMIINHGTRIVVADSDRDNQPGVSPSLAVVDVEQGTGRAARAARLRPGRDDPAPVRDGPQRQHAAGHQHQLGPAGEPERRQAAVIGAALGWCACPMSSVS